MTNKEKIKYFYENIVSNNLLEEYKEFIDENCQERGIDGNATVGLKGMEDHAIAIRGTYPDLKLIITRQFEEGDYVISEFIMEGTFSREWLGMKPKEKKLIFNGVNVDKMINGKIIEHSGVMNTFETLFEAEIIKPS